MDFRAMDVDERRQALRDPRPDTVADQIERR
jgi:hypothetical protein